MAGGFFRFVEMRRRNQPAMKPEALGGVGLRWLSVGLQRLLSVEVIAFEQD